MVQRRSGAFMAVSGRTQASCPNAISFMDDLPIREVPLPSPATSPKQDGEVDRVRVNLTPRYS